MPTITKVYVLTMDAVYESDETHQVMVFTDKDKAVEYYINTARKEIDDCTNTDGTPAADISDIDPDDLDAAALEGSFVFESSDSKDPDKVKSTTMVYCYGEYAWNHSITRLEEVNLDGTIHKTGLTKPGNHNKI